MVNYYVVVQFSDNSRTWKGLNSEGEKAIFVEKFLLDNKRREE